MLIFNLPILAFGLGFNAFGDNSSELNITNGFGYNKPVGSFGSSKVKFGFSSKEDSVTGNFGETLK